MLSEALSYAALSLLPVPLYGVNPDGSCTCSKPGCRAAGKHPTEFEWQRKATLDPNLITERFQNHQGNIGIYLANNLVLIDADGEVGVDTLMSFEDLPETLSSVSGSWAGVHLIYRLAPGQSADEITDRNKFAPGVDVKIRGQFVAPPSKHSSGLAYTWHCFREPELLPDSLYQRIRRPPVSRAPSDGAVESKGFERVRRYIAAIPPAVSGEGGHNRAFQTACVLVRQGLTEDEEARIFAEYSDRCQPPWSPREQEHKLEEARRKSTTQPIKDRAPVDGDWKRLLKFHDTRNGAALDKSAYNVHLILTHDPAWRDKLKFDVFVQNIVVTDPPWLEGTAATFTEEYWTDGDTVLLQTWLQYTHGLALPRNVVEDGLLMFTRSHAVDSARDWMDSLLWDGTPRLSRWLSTYIGAEDTFYTRAVGKWWLISAVARVYAPGCKADHMLILYGEQGRGKSTAASILAGPQWFADTPITMGEKDSYLALQGKLIYELAELETLNRSEQTAAKSFVAALSDNYRAPYMRRAVKVPRRCVFLGTTNQEEMLKDDTGDRRYWPVKCGTIDLAGLRADREQLWAEAVASYQAGDKWHPASEFEVSLCKAAQDLHKVSEPWLPRALQWMAAAGKTKATVADLLEGIGIPLSQWDLKAKARAARCFVQAGWSLRNDANFDGHRQRYYCAPESVDV